MEFEFVDSLGEIWRTAPGDYLSMSDITEYRSWVEATRVAASRAGRITALVNVRHIVHIRER